MEDMVEKFRIKPVPVNAIGKQMCVQSCNHVFCCGLFLHNTSVFEARHGLMHITPLCCFQIIPVVVSGQAGTVVVSQSDLGRQCGGLRMPYIVTSARSAALMLALAFEHATTSPKCREGV